MDHRVVKKEEQEEEEEVIIDDESDFVTVVRGKNRKKQLLLAPPVAASGTEEDAVRPSPMSFVDKMRAHGFDRAVKVPLRPPVDRWAFWNDPTLPPVDSTTATKKQTQKPQKPQHISLGPIVSKSSIVLGNGEIRSLTLASDKYELQFRTFTGGCPPPHGHFTLHRGNLDELVGDTITGAVVVDRRIPDAAAAARHQAKKDKSTTTDDAAANEAEDKDEEDSGLVAAFGTERYILYLKSGAKVILIGTHAHYDRWACTGTTMARRLNIQYCAPLHQRSTRARAVIVVGLPSSGKSDFLRDTFGIGGGGGGSIGGSNGGGLGDQYEVIDDFFRLHDGDAHAQVAELLHRGGGVVVADRGLCDKTKFKHLYDLVSRFVAVPADQICVVYFENDPEGCRRPSWIMRLVCSDTSEPLTKEEYVSLPWWSTLSPGMVGDSKAYAETVAFIESAQCAARVKHRLPVWGSATTLRKEEELPGSSDRDDHNNNVPTTLFVGNLPLEMTETELLAVLQEEDDASMVGAPRIVTTKEKVSRGFGFVTYSSERQARRVLASLDGKDLADGRRMLRLAVDKKTEKEKEKEKEK